jgi:hypothetical protein
MRALITSRSPCWTFSGEGQHQCAKLLQLILLPLTVALGLYDYTRVGDIRHGLRYFEPPD